MGAPALASRAAPAPARRAPARRAPTPGAPASRKPSGRSRADRAGARAPVRRAPSRRSPGGARAALAPRPNPALAGAALIPTAAARTAGAVRDLSDSGAIVRLSSGRGWIALLCALLGGIVALNVVSLSINATSGRVSEAIDHYEQSNSALRAEIAEQLSASRVEAAAASLGLAVPAPEQVTYLDARDGDLARLASVWGGEGLLAYDDGYAGATTTSYGSGYEPEAATGSAPAPSASAAPATGAPAPSPAVPAAPAAPAAPAPSGGASTGGVGL